MPDSSRSSVDFPAPLWPTRPTLAPCANSRSMSRSASMIGTFWPPSMFPPTSPSTVFFSERLRPSNTGKSTQAPERAMLTSVSVEVVVMVGPGYPELSDPVRHAAAVPPQDVHREAPADHGDHQHHPPEPGLLRLPEHGPAQDLDEVQEGVELGQPGPLGNRRVRAVEQCLVHP